MSGVLLEETVFTTSYSSVNQVQIGPCSLLLGSIERQLWISAGRCFSLFFFASRRLMLSLSSSSWTLRYQDWFIDSRCYSSLCYLKFFCFFITFYCNFSLGYSLSHSWLLSELLSIVIQTYSISVVQRMRKESPGQLQ